MELTLEGRDPWLDQLVDEVERWSSVVAEATPTADAVDAARDAAAVATLRLDGSPLTAVPPLPDELPEGTRTGPARGGWLEVLRSGGEGLEQLPDEVVLAIEHRGARAGLDAVDLGLQLREQPLPALQALHGRITEGLLAPATAGAPRRTPQAVHDASIGRVLFFPVAPEQVEQRTARLAEWLAATDQHPLLVSGIAHHQVLDIHPFEAANGRLARTVGRLLLAAAGIDPELVGQPEAALLADPIGYLDEVGRSRRLDSPQVFVTRWAEAVADGLRSAAHSLGVAPPTEVPDATVRHLRESGGAPFTVVEHRDATGGSDDDLQAALDAGLARRVYGTRGLRWRAVVSDDRPADDRP